MRQMKAAMKVHEEKCDGSSLMIDINKKQESIPNPSYSMTQALEEFFSIIMHNLYT